MKWCVFKHNLTTAKTKKQIENCLISELSNLVGEFKSNQLTEENLYNYFRHFMLDAEVDSEIVVNVLEDKYFGNLGKEEARSIKIYEGW